MEQIFALMIAFGFVSFFISVYGTPKEMTENENFVAIIFCIAGLVALLSGLLGLIIINIK